MHSRFFTSAQLTSFITGCTQLAAKPYSALDFVSPQIGLASGVIFGSYPHPAHIQAIAGSFLGSTLYIIIDNFLRLSVTEPKLAIITAMTITIFTLECLKINHANEPGNAMHRP